MTLDINGSEYPESVRTESSAVPNCFYNYGDLKLQGSENWLAWSDSIMSDLDVYDYWKYYDGTYPRPPDLSNEEKKMLDKQIYQQYR